MVEQHWGNPNSLQNFSDKLPTGGIRGKMNSAVTAFTNLLLERH
jgi:hypothetical protein